MTSPTLNTKTNSDDKPKVHGWQTAYDICKARLEGNPRKAMQAAVAFDLSRKEETER